MIRLLLLHTQVLVDARSLRQPVSYPPYADLVLTAGHRFARRSGLVDPRRSSEDHQLSLNFATVHHGMLPTVSALGRALLTPVIRSLVLAVFCSVVICRSMESSS